MPGSPLDGPNTWPPGGDKPWVDPLDRAANSGWQGATSGAVIESQRAAGSDPRNEVHPVRRDHHPGLLLVLCDAKTRRPRDPPSSVVQCAECEEALAGGILHLCGPGRAISAFANLTVIRPGDMADRDAAALTSTPEWHGIRKRLLLPGRRGCDPSQTARSKPRIK